MESNEDSRGDIYHPNNTLPFSWWSTRVQWKISEILREIKEKLRALDFNDEDDNEKWIAGGLKKFQLWEVILDNNNIHKISRLYFLLS